MGSGQSLLTQYDIEDVQQHVDGRFSQEEIAALYRRFCALDRSGKGYVTGDELLTIPEFSLNPLVNRLTAMLESVNFKEFVAWLAAFSARATAEERVKLIFRVYDVDNDGKISRADILTILRDLSGTYLTDEQRELIVSRALQQAGFSTESDLSFADVMKVIGSTARLQVDIPVED